MQKFIIILSVWLLISCLRTDEFSSTWRRLEPGSLLVQTLERFFADCVGIGSLVGSIWDHAFNWSEITKAENGFFEEEISGNPSTEEVEIIRILAELDEAEEMLLEAENSLSRGLFGQRQLQGIQCEMDKVLASNERLRSLSPEGYVSSKKNDQALLRLSLARSFSQDDQRRWIPMIEACKTGVRKRRTTARRMLKKFQSPDFSLLSNPSGLRSLA